MTGERVARRITVHGRVQGVYFRAWTIEQAQAIGGIDGWVRNRADGSVEAVAAGAADKVDALVARMRQGSPASRVERIEVEETPGVVAAGFVQKPSV